MMCNARQYSDQMLCDRCGLQWDVNDADPPQCPRPVPQERYLADKCERQRYAEEQIRRIMALFDT